MRTLFSFTSVVFAILSLAVLTLGTVLILANKFDKWGPADYTLVGLTLLIFAILLKPSPAKVE